MTGVQTCALPIFDSSYLPLAMGFVDETDTHVTPQSIEYVLSGRDTIGRLVDNAVVDANNAIINTKQVTLETILKVLLKNTGMPQQYVLSGSVPNSPMLFQTNPGETKISALQRYLEFSNCLIWSDAFGRAVMGKPNFSQASSGTLAISSTETSRNNLLEARVRRNLNLSIRQIVTQLQTMGQVDPGAFTVKNQDPDMKAVTQNYVGRSVYRVFSYGQGTDAVNQIYQVGNGQGAPKV